MLTASEIEQKTFSTALRGYDLDEVDDFLDEIVATVRELSDQLEAARATAIVKPAMEQPSAVPSAPPEPERTPSAIDEGAIGRALLAAQTAADKLVEDAESEAARIVEEARDEADSWTVEREQKQREAEAQVAAFATRVASIRSELAVLAGEVAGKLDDMDAVLEDEPTSAPPGTNFESETADEATDGGSDHVDTGDVPTDEPDHLEDALTGVANDLRLDAADDNTDFDVAAFEPRHREEEE